MAKISSVMYSLEAVGLYDELYDKAKEIIRQAGYKQIELAHLVVNGTGLSLSESTQERADLERAAGKEVWWSQYCYEWSETDPESPARLKFATPDQVNRWVELAMWKGQRERPALLWVRMKMPDPPKTLVVDEQTGLPLEDQLPRKRS